MDEKRIFIDIIVESVLKELENKAKLHKTTTFLIPPDKHLSYTKISSIIILKEEHADMLMKLAKIFMCTPNTLLSFLIQKFMESFPAKKKAIQLGGLSKDTIKILDELEETRQKIAEAGFKKGKGIKKKPLDKKLAKFLVDGE